MKIEFEQNEGQLDLDVTGGGLRLAIRGKMVAWREQSMLCGSTPAYYNADRYIYSSLRPEDFTPTQRQIADLLDQAAGAVLLGGAIHTVSTRLLDADRLGSEAAAEVAAREAAEEAAREAEEAEAARVAAEAEAEAADGPAEAEAPDGD